MKFVALISGGKDSIHNVLKCVEHGHELVALANLQPPPAVDELDSWMYQSVGHELVAAYAVALGVPLLRRETHGRARCTALRYAAHADDEVEQLGALLDAICAAHPAVRGVAVGTILSDYQRLRVEHVCRARQLVPLAYLWQREQRALLDEMLEQGTDAVFAKVACMGLKRHHVGKPLAMVRDELHRLEAHYGVHVCGEGGEFETLTLDSPLFCKRIVLDRTESVVHSDDPFAPVVYLRVLDYHLEDKPHDATRIEATANRDGDTFMRAAVPTLISNWNERAVDSAVRCDAEVVDGDVASLRGVRGSSDLAALFAHCFKQLKARGFEQESVAFVSLRLRSMSLYGELNAVYDKIFADDPPARLCVAEDTAALGDADDVVLDVLAYRGRTKTLHVQSISDWAPASIGPYSQAKELLLTEAEAPAQHSLILLAGQIALDPGTMRLDSGSSVADQFSRCEQSAFAVAATLSNRCSVEAIGARVERCTVFATTAAMDDARSAASKRGYSDRCNFVPVTGLPRDASVELQYVVRREDEQAKDAKSIGRAALLLTHFDRFTS